MRRRVIVTGHQIEDRQFEVGWFAGSRQHDRAEHLHLAIDSTVISATLYEEVSKFEVIAGRIERDDQMARRFVCALPRRVLTSTPATAPTVLRALIDDTSSVPLKFTRQKFKDLEEFDEACGTNQQTNSPLERHFHLRLSLRFELAQSRK